MANGGREPELDAPTPVVSLDLQGRLPVTAIVVVCDEAARLPACLASLSFCTEVVVVDLESSDDSAEIARRMGARVIAQERRPIVEQIYPYIVGAAKTDWLLLIDPDEVFPYAGARLLQDVLSGDPDVALVEMPWQFYFRDCPLRGTRWGEQHHKRMLVHRARVEFRPIVHAGIVIREPYQMVQIDWSEAACVAHYWADSYRQLLAKHRRYIPREVERRRARGAVFRWRTLISLVSRTFWREFFVHHGWKGGIDGWILSAFRGWYEGAILWGLRVPHTSGGRGSATDI